MSHAHLLDLAALLAACSAPSDPGGATPIVSGPGFFDRPFPSDARMVDGHPDYSGFPEIDRQPMLAAYAATAESLDGFGTNAPIYVRFEDDFNPDDLPTATASIDLAQSPLLLLNVDPDSPRRGSVVPVDATWHPDVGRYLPGNLLAVAPVWGFPLRPNTTYALVLRPPLVGVGDWSGDWSDPALADTAETLRAIGLRPEALGLAVPFTTQDPVRETARVARAIVRGEVGSAPLGGTLTYVDDRTPFDLWEGKVTVPIWQEGARPYRDTGGAFVFDEAGAPVVQAWETIRFSLAVPQEDAPASGWPVVLYSHGTGGSDRSCCGTSDTDEARVLAREGVAVFAIAQPLHGDRATPGTNEELDSFNFVNPDAGRTNFRQGALDQVYLARLLAAGATFDTPNGAISLDPERVAYMGHSQGGLVGAIAQPFMAPYIRAAVHSGAGGGLANTIVLRKDPVDLALLLAGVLEFAEGELVTDRHPVVGLIQTLSEATDPINYGAHWFAEQRDWAGAAQSRPVPTLLTEGMLDDYTPSVTSEALAAAARLPVLGEPAFRPESFDLRGLAVDVLPTAGNATDWNGAPITAGLAQYAADGHFAIYDNRDATRLYREFLSSALSGTPEFED